MRRRLSFALFAGLAVVAALSAASAGESQEALDAKAKRAEALDLDALYETHFLPFDYEDGGAQKTVRFPYRLFRTDGVKNAGADARFPLVVYLHGAGEFGTDGKGQMKHFTREAVEYLQRKNVDAIVAVPQIDHANILHWWTNERAQAALEALFLHLIKTYPVDPDRVYLTGVSMGGMGTWAFLNRRPDLLAAAIPICGNGKTENAARADRPRNMKDVPVWAFHGENDSVVAVSGTRDMVTALEAAKAPVFYSEEPYGGHALWPQIYNKDIVWNWLLAQKRGQPVVRPEQPGDKLTTVMPVPTAPPRR